MNIDDALASSLTRIAQALRAGDLTAIDLVDALLARIERLQPRLHAYAIVDAAGARAQARACDEALASGRPLSPLHGVPVAVKDLCETQGIVTAAGMTIHADHIPQADATVVARLKAAGAILIGKLQMTEGAYAGHHPRITAPVNPWGAEYWPGVSSSGSGVATAASLCFGALGSDTLGSIRFPSTMNGVTGLKPTWGRVSRAGVFPLAESMDHVGPMARSAADAARLLAVIAGADVRDPTAARVPVPDYDAAIAQGVRGLRIGIDRALIAAHAETDMDIAADHVAGTLAAQGAQIVDMDTPALDDIARDAVQLCAVQTAFAHAATYPARHSDYGPALTGLIETGLAVDARALVGILQRREAFAGLIDALFSDIDLMLWPAMNRASPRLDEMARQAPDSPERFARIRFTAPIDMSRNPSLTLPAGFTAAGMPVGVQIIGRCFDEARVLAAGHAFQQSTDWHRRRPPL